MIPPSVCVKLFVDYLSVCSYSIFRKQCLKELFLWNKDYFIQSNFIIIPLSYVVLKRTDLNCGELFGH